MARGVRRAIAMLDQRHDPGPEGANERVARLPTRHSAPIGAPSGGSILVGTASWTDPTMVAPGVFYPRGVSSAEDRLRYYADQFPLVEVDSTYYAIPARRMAELWMERTPAEFTFNIKAHALMTGQPTEVARLPRELREALPAEMQEKRRVYATELPREIHDAVWAEFLDALEPLRSSGKLGAILLQYPKWFMPNPQNKEAILDSIARLGDIPGAVEFRNRRWFGDDSERSERTLSFLAEHEIPYVMVDEPQGMESSVPPIVAVTNPKLAVVRFHGRRAETWEKQNRVTSERYRYLYDQDELAEWTPKVLDVASEAREVHVLWNNCYANYGTTNAREMTALLAEAVRE